MGAGWWQTVEERVAAAVSSAGLMALEVCETSNQIGDSPNLRYAYSHSHNVKF
jgi:hypothetical protein